MQHVSLVTENLEKRNERILPLIIPKKCFHLLSSIKTFFVLIVTISRRWCVHVVRKLSLFRKSVHVCLWTQMFMSRLCSTTARSFHFFLICRGTAAWNQRTTKLHPNPGTGLSTTRCVDRSPFLSALRYFTMLLEAQDLLITLKLPWREVVSPLTV